MEGVLTGFVTIGAVIGVGILLAHLGILDESSQRVLARLAFFVASPALMITVLGETDVSALFSANLLASLGGVTVVATTLPAAGPAGLAPDGQRHGDRDLLLGVRQCREPRPADRRVRAGRRLAGRPDAAHPVAGAAADRDGGAGRHDPTDPAR